MPVKSEKDSTSLTVIRDMPEGNIYSKKNIVARVKFAREPLELYISGVCDNVLWANESEIQLFIYPRAQRMHSSMPKNFQSKELHTNCIDWR